MDVTFSLSYAKNEDTNEILMCADIVRMRFEDIGGSVRGAHRLKEIQPSGLTKITAEYSRTYLNDFTCPTDEVCSRFLCVQLYTIFRKFCVHNYSLFSIRLCFLTPVVVYVTNTLGLL